MSKVSKQEKFKTAGGLYIVVVMAIFGLNVSMQNFTVVDMATIDMLTAALVSTNIAIFQRITRFGHPMLIVGSLALQIVIPGWLLLHTVGVIALPQKDY
ncbi:hypothetical protein [Vibrio barjaei]|uniref:hypothetical protein n=1 Tax=Vibrio barjaei TaxID=1676683 RepID=UPI002284866A|nr:hypothetical protein [Vibrio barjaei]MCY9870430.1 hypothetical protein [Vibrio barjaei]